MFLEILFITGLREWCAQTDERNAPPRIPVMVNMTSASVSSEKGEKLNASFNPSAPTDQINAASRNSVMMEEYSDEDEEYQIAEPEQEVWFASVPFFLCLCFLKSEQNYVSFSGRSILA